MSVNVEHGDCRDVLRDMAARGVLFDSCVTDPPYHLASIVKRFGKEGSAPVKVPEGGTGAYARASRGFMGKEWDGGGVAFDVETWRAVYDVLKPGAHLFAFGGTRTYHRMVCAIEDAGFEIRDQFGWAFGSGFPKSHDIAKAIDRAAGAEGQRTETGAAVRRIRPGADQNRDGSWEKLEDREYNPHSYEPATEAARQWQGWGTAAKPAWEPICLARKPLSEKSIAANVLRHGTGALNIDGCRVEGGARPHRVSDRRLEHNTYSPGLGGSKHNGETTLGRWPANLCHDGSPEVLACFPETSGQHGEVTGREPSSKTRNTWALYNERNPAEPRHDSGSAARFFYQAKAGPDDRLDSKHPTVKPVSLIRWLMRMITPPGGHVLDPFAGSGTAGTAAIREGFDATLIEREAEYIADIERRLAHIQGGDTPLFQEAAE